MALLVAAPLAGQQKRLWVLRPPDEMVEYDPETFAVKQTVKVPAEAVKSPQDVAVNHLGQILFAPAVVLPLGEEDVQATGGRPAGVKAAHLEWFWNGRTANTIDQGVKRAAAPRGSNQEITESAPVAYLSADGKHLFWFANQAKRLQREDVDLSTTTTWQAWRTDVNGEGREDLASVKLPDCRCPTGSCEESCAYEVVWAPEGGIDKFFLLTQFIAGQTGSSYEATVRYQEQDGKWTALPLAEPLQRLLDADSAGNVIVEAIPDAGCCGWSNQSNDQTLVLANGKTLTVFDEQATYKNADYDVSFYTTNAWLSPELGYVAMTITATAEPNKPIQLSEQGQANPEESLRIRKGLAELPAVEVKSIEDGPRRVEFVPHATAAGWISEKELLIVEDHLLVVCNVGTGSRRKSNVRVEDAGSVFLR